MRKIPLLAKRKFEPIFIQVLCQFLETAGRQSGSRLAERGGFEPPIRREANTRFRVERLQPTRATSPLQQILQK